MVSRKEPFHRDCALECGTKAFAADAKYVRIISDVVLALIFVVLSVGDGQKVSSFWETSSLTFFCEKTGSSGSWCLNQPADVITETSFTIPSAHGLSHIFY